MEAAQSQFRSTAYKGPLLACMAAKIVRPHRWAERVPMVQQDQGRGMTLDARMTQTKYKYQKCKYTSTTPYHTTPHYTSQTPPHTKLVEHVIVYKEKSSNLLIHEQQPT